MEQCTGATKCSTETKKARDKFILYLLGVILHFSAYLAMTNLQSSLNIEDGLGTIALSTKYVSAAVFSILFTPLVVRRFGAKRCLCASEVAHTLFILANIHPAFTTLIPGAISAGIGEAIIWTCMPIMNVHLAKHYSSLRNHDTKRNEFYTTLFTGCFFTSIQLCQVIGNLITYVALYAFDTASPSSEDESQSENTTTIYSTSPTDAVQEYYYCGANDCQDPDIIRESRDQYSPTNEVTVIVLMSIFVIMCIISIILHIVFLPDVAFPDQKKEKKYQNPVATYDNDAYNPDVNHDQKQYVDSQVKSNEKRVIEPEESSNSLEHQEIHIVPLMKKSVKDLGKHLIRIKQILILPITLYNGLSMGFAFTELTRSYSSCVLGVDQIGICMAIYGFADATLSLVVGKYSRKLKRPFFFLLALAIDIGNYTYCLLWNPNPDSSWSVYLVFFTLGFTDGIWQTLINVMYIEYFPKHQEIAQTSWNFLVIVGFAAQFAWSSFLCVYIKIYIQFGFLAIGILSYGASEFIQKKEKRRKVDGDKSPDNNRVAEVRIVESYANIVS